MKNWTKLERRRGQKGCFELEKVTEVGFEHWEEKSPLARRQSAGISPPTTKRQTSGNRWIPGQKEYGRRDAPKGKWFTAEDREREEVRGWT